MANDQLPIQDLPASRYLEATIVGTLGGLNVERENVVAYDPNTDEVRLDYANPGDGNNRLTYEGTNLQGTATSDPTWIVRKFTWAAGPVAGDFVVTRIEILMGSWDNRASLPW